MPMVGFARIGSGRGKSAGGVKSTAPLLISSGAVRSVSPEAHYPSAAGSGMQNHTRQNNSRIVNFEFE